MRVLTLDEIKKSELEIFRAFVDVCEKEGFYYTLAYGTLIGAIRHKGFIPWDDDIDVFMPRPDYDRFFEKYSVKGMPHGFRIIGPQNGGQTSYIKVVDERTHVHCDNLTENARANDHLWIDIFPLDGMPKSRLVMIVKTLIVQFSYKILALVVMKPRENRWWIRRMIRKLVKFLFRRVTANDIARFQDWSAAMHPIDRSECIGNFLYGGYEASRRIPKREFLIPQKVDFEGMKLNAPSNYDAILRMAYGNYMEMPPESARVTHQLHVEVED